MSDCISKRAHGTPEMIESLNDGVAGLRRHLAALIPAGFAWVVTVAADQLTVTIHPAKANSMWALEHEAWSVGDAVEWVEGIDWQAARAEMRAAVRDVTTS